MNGYQTGEFIEVGQIALKIFRDVPHCRGKPINHLPYREESVCLAKLFRLFANKTFKILSVLLYFLSRRDSSALFKAIPVSSLIALNKLWLEFEASYGKIMFHDR
jgi:hypothetical protein